MYFTYILLVWPKKCVMTSFIMLAPRAGVLKLWTSAFLMYYRLLNLDYGNQIWKFMFRYFGKYFTFLVVHMRFWENMGTLEAVYMKCFFLL